MDNAELHSLITLGENTYVIPKYFAISVLTSVGINRLITKVWITAHTAVSLANLTCFSTLRSQERLWLSGTTC